MVKELAKFNVRIPSTFIHPFYVFIFSSSINLFLDYIFTMILLNGKRDLDLDFYCYFKIIAIVLMSTSTLLYLYYSYIDAVK